MAKAKYDLGGYVEVQDRIKEFYERFPEGTLRCKKWSVQEFGGQAFVVYEALAYRSPEDKLPGEGKAWEPYPGKSSFTRNSELMNAETSAWGRAIAALGIATNRSVASAEEVQNRKAERDEREGIGEKAAEGYVETIEFMKIEPNDLKMQLVAIAPDVVPDKFTKGWTKRAVALLTEDEAKKLDEWMRGLVEEGKVGEPVEEAA